MTAAPPTRCQPETNEALARDCELYAKIIEGIIVVEDDWKPGDPERREPRATLLKVAAALRAAPVPQCEAEPVAWLDLRTAGLGWQNRIVATNPQFVTNNGPENFAPLYAAPARCDAESSWLPITTAPKDGTPILAANSRYHIHAPVVVRWDGRNEDGAEPHWCDAATTAGDALYFNPNYFDLWMPAPVVPSARGNTP